MGKKEYKELLKTYKQHKRIYLHRIGKRNKSQWRYSEGLWMSGKEQLVMDIIWECLQKSRGNSSTISDIQLFLQKKLEYAHGYFAGFFKTALLILWIKKKIHLRGYVREGRIIQVIEMRDKEK